MSREVLEQLTTLQVSAALLYRKDLLVKCSNVRNHFTWRAPELQQLADETVGAGSEDPGKVGGGGACMWRVSKEWDAATPDFRVERKRQRRGRGMKEGPLPFG